MFVWREAASMAAPLPTVGLRIWARILSTVRVGSVGEPTTLPASARVDCACCPCQNSATAPANRTTSIHGKIVRCQRFRPIRALSLLCVFAIIQTNPECFSIPLRAPLVKDDTMVHVTAQIHSLPTPQRLRRFAGGCMCVRENGPGAVFPHAHTTMASRVAARSQERGPE